MIFPRVKFPTDVSVRVGGRARLSRLLSRMKLYGRDRFHAHGNFKLGDRKRSKITFLKFTGRVFSVSFFPVFFLSLLSLATRLRARTMIIYNEATNNRDIQMLRSHRSNRADKDCNSPFPARSPLSQGAPSAVFKVGYVKDPITTQNIDFSPSPSRHPVCNANRFFSLSYAFICVYIM